MPRPRGGDWLTDELQSLREMGVDVLVSLLTTEEERELELDQEGSLCVATGLEYASFPVEDRDLPAANVVDFIRTLASQLQAGRSIAVHCRMGIGRSSLIAASVLGLLGTESDAAFAMIATARGMTVPDTPEQRDWVSTFLKRYGPSFPDAG